MQRLAGALKLHRCTPQALCISFFLLLDVRVHFVGLGEHSLKLGHPRSEAGGLET